MVERIAQTRPIWSIFMPCPEHEAPTSLVGSSPKLTTARPPHRMRRVERQQPWPAEIARRFGFGVQRLLNTVETSEFLALESVSF